MKTLSRPARHRRYASRPDGADSVIGTVAVMRSMTPGSADQFIQKTKSNALTLMHGYRASGRIDIGQRFLADLDHALSSAPVDLKPEAVKAVFRRSQEADAAEMEAGEEYHLAPSPSSARRWRIASESSAFAHQVKTRVLRALEELAS